MRTEPIAARADAPDRLCSAGEHDPRVAAWRMSDPDVPADMLERTGILYRCAPCAARAILATSGRVRAFSRWNGPGGSPGWLALENTRTGELEGIGELRTDRTWYVTLWARDTAAGPFTVGSWSAGSSRVAFDGARRKLEGEIADRAGLPTCAACGHSEYEHGPDMGPCAECVCRAFT